MTTTREPRAAPTAVLTPDRLARLGAVFADAIAYRQPSGDCTGCADDPGGLCGDHAADLGEAEDHARLRDELGIEEK